MIQFDFPEHMDDLLYFTNRKLSDGTKILAYVHKKSCPECDNALMGKPINPKTKKIQIRAKEYVCPNCGYEEEKLTHENTLQLEIQYTNPQQTEKKTTHTAYKRKTYKGIPSFVFLNEFTQEKCAITKRLKAKKDED